MESKAVDEVDYLCDISESTEWSKQFPDSNGIQQSPINLISKTAVFDPKLKEKLLSVSYLPSRETDILNNGQAVVIYPKARSGKIFFFVLWKQLYA